MPINLLGGGAGGGMGNMLPMMLGQMGAGMAGGGKKGGSPIAGAMQQMMPLLQQKREQEMWEALQRRIQQQGMIAGDMGRMASPGMQAGGAGPPMGAMY